MRSGLHRLMCEAQVMLRDVDVKMNQDANRRGVLIVAGPAKSPPGT